LEFQESEKKHVSSLV